MKDFFYMSEQVHSVWNDGKGKTRRNIVQIRGKNGIKAVETYDYQGKQLSRKEKALTAQELACIQRKEFIPGLFKDCIQPLEPAKKNKAHRRTRKHRALD